MIIKPLSKVRFEALAGYTRHPNIVLIIKELEWYATVDERVLGMLTFDRSDRDFGWVIFGRDEKLRFRAIDVDASLASPEEARARLLDKLADYKSQADETFWQKDTSGAPVDFFQPVVEASRLNPIFKMLCSERRWTPARGIIEPMMRFYEDPDGNFVEQFQTTAFDARLWELYLFATFVELGYARQTEIAAPDFILTSPFGAFGLEATTINPPDSQKISLPTTKDELAPYLENFVPIRLARVLKRKLKKRKPYWLEPAMAGLPFVIAVQDFHAPMAMRAFTQVATEYVFGVRHSIDNGKQKIEWIASHMWGKMSEKSGYFRLPKSENVSAIVLNPQGTISKFNRMGFLAGFGERRLKIIHRGLARGEHNREDPRPTFFARDVTASDYSEQWVSGMVVLHNPNARVPLSPDAIPGASHVFLQPDGKIMSLFPNFHPYMSETIILEPRESDKAAADTAPRTG